VANFLILTLMNVFDPTGLPSSRAFSLWEPDTDMSDADPDLIVTGALPT
jgi:hypothetical protein